MAHYGLLREYRFSDDVDDIRGATLYDENDDKLGKVEDVIFDHASGNIQYAVVDTGGWLRSKRFLVPADRIYPAAGHKNDFATHLTREQIESLPEYDEKMVGSDADWNDYDERYREAWGAGPVLHQKDSTHMITPQPEELHAGSGSGADDQAFEPERLAGKFPAVAPGAGKLRMRPSGIAADAEDSRLPGGFAPAEKPTLASEEAGQRSANVQAQRDHLTNPGEVYVSERQRHQRWAAFEEHLRRNHVDITASCRSCGTAREKVA